MMKTNDDKNSKTLSLVIQPNHFIFTENAEYTRPSLLISRNASLEVTLQKTPSLNGAVYEKVIHAILGIIPILSGPYLILVTDCEAVGTLDGNVIYCVKSIDLLPIFDKAAADRLPTQAKNDERIYLDLLQQVLMSPYFYFSYSFDLSRPITSHLKSKLKKFSLRASIDASPDESPEPHRKRRSENPSKNGIPAHPDLWANIDDRFVWNSHLVARFAGLSSKFGNWFPPLIQGFISIKKDCVIQTSPHNTSDKVSSGKCEFGLAIISRRNKKRAGVRYHTRGVDQEGNVANNVETEQILMFPDGTFSSFLQIRGSVPVSWKQDPNLDYDPPILVDEPNSKAPFHAHFKDQLEAHQKIIAIDLLNTHGKESKIGSSYKKHVETYGNPQLKYVGFDVHKHCKTTNYDKMSLLEDEVRDEMRSMAFTIFDGKTETVTQTQNGVFRTNCKDCLDRTNLVQGVLARMSLVDQLVKLGIIQDMRDLTSVKNTDFMSYFRNVWADNGDTISVFYAGTGALKSTVTRTGKTSYQGLINDGVNSVTRYYLNNLKDGLRQDSIELLLGNYVPSKLSSPFSEKSSIFLYLLTVTLTIFHAIAPKQIKHRFDFVIVMFWLLLLVFIGKIFRFTKGKIINKPKLIGLKKAKHS